MKKTFVLAPDSFKESMTAKEVCDAMEKGFKKVYPEAEYIKVPMADGGEGTVQSLVDATGGFMKTSEVMGPRGTAVQANYGILGDGKTGIIEMSEASGIQLISEGERNPLLTSTFGTGQLMIACLKEGVSKLIIGIGGSATNDGGTGMAVALGAKFYGRNGRELPLGGGALNELQRIDTSGVTKLLENVEVIVACDVINPLCGDNGASAIFGPQKGATEEMVKILDNNLAHYASIVKEQVGKDIKDVPGAGAAGGLGAGLLVFAEATLKKGIDIVIEYAKLEEKISRASYVITGEGGIDSQTINGKTPYGVARTGKKYNRPVIAIAGQVGQNIDGLYDEGFTAIFGIVPKMMPIEEAMKNGPENIEATCYNIAKLLDC